MVYDILYMVYDIWYMIRVILEGERYVKEAAGVAVPRHSLVYASLVRLATIGRVLEKLPAGHPAVVPRSR